jgi:rhodanese-related sulfurtransferase
VQRVVEVLPVEEFEAEHLPGALSVHLKELRAESAAGILRPPNPRRSVVVCCMAAD